MARCMLWWGDPTGQALRPPLPTLVPRPPNHARRARRLGGFNGTFFAGGWGDLACVNLREVRPCGASHP